jgi:regulatory protein
MQVSEIRKLSGGRCLVTMEDGSSFPLYTKELADYHIEEEALLPAEEMQRILSELLPRRARMCAMHYLEKADRTEHQLRTKLMELYYPEQIVDQAVAYVRGYHYIDDVRYAIHYIEVRRDTRSMRMIEQELMRRGISREDFQKAAQQTEEPDELSQIRLWMEKKHFDPSSADQKEKERMYCFLMRRGYGSAVVSRAVRTELY